MLAAPADDPPLEVDAELRPEGKNGPLVRTFAAYQAYYEKWSAVWEAQALLRANADDRRRRSSASAFTALIDPLRWPEGGATPDEVREIRRIKARVDSERLPRGANPNTHLKLGRGGLADVEWTVQLLQMQHAHDVPELRTTRTLDALHAAPQGRPDLRRPTRDVLETAWRLVSRIRNAVVLMRGKPAESMVEQARRTRRRRPSAGLWHGPERAHGRRLPAHDPPGSQGRGAHLLRLSGLHRGQGVIEST